MEHRFTISVSDDIKTKFDKLKKEEFYNKSQSEMVRQIVALGLEAKEAGCENGN